ncbi:sodium/mannose cotransporter SLC5A10-like [Lineus longissimus]|uniref:sodium/mannose cotransporter SLC5A10-like n=1 Tax=Lineus longissimus TaxID=88925 RepID=UPI002B4E159B
MADLEVGDYVIIGIHFVITVIVGLWPSCRGGRSSAKGYFLAGRAMPWWLVGTSLFMSNIGSSTFIALAGASSSVGIAVICYEYGGLFGVLLLGFLFMPVYISSGVYTMPEYLQKRFGGKRLKIYYAVLSLLLFLFTKLSAEIYAGAVIIKATLGWDVYVSVLALLAATALYTVLGGLAAVIYTDFLQAVVTLISATILAIMSMIRIGGYEAMKNKYMDAVGVNATMNSTCGHPDPYAFNIMRPATDPNYPWPGTVFGASILATLYFCTDQVLAQRILAAKDLTHAKAGSVLAACLKVLPIFIMIWPGLASRVFFPETLACATADDCRAACGNAAGCADVAYPKLVLEILPVGLRGLMLAAMLAALMSSLTSIFNSGGTVFTIDLWTEFRKKASETEQMIVSRLFVLVFVGLAVAWLPLLENTEGGQLVNYLQGVNSYLAPPTLSCYLAAVLWKRTNEQGAFWGLMVGLILGVVRMIASFALPAPPCGQPDTRPDILAKWHFLHYAVFLFVLSLVVTVVVSLLTEQQKEEELQGLTWLTRNQVNRSTLKDEETEVEAVLSDLDKTLGDEVKYQPKESCARRSFNFICGVTSEDSKVPDEERKAMEEKMNMLAMSENPKWRKFVNISALFMVAVGVFFVGFFS